jgi:hypothetical protein
VSALRKEAGLFCGSLLRKGEVFAYAGSIQNLKDLKERDAFLTPQEACFTPEKDQVTDPRLPEPLTLNPKPPAGIPLRLVKG